MSDIYRSVRDDIARLAAETARVNANNLPTQFEGELEKAWIQHNVPYSESDKMGEQISVAVEDDLSEIKDWYVAIEEGIVTQASVEPMPMKYLEPEAKPKSKCKVQNGSANEYWSPDEKVSLIGKIINLFWRKK